MYEYMSEMAIGVHLLSGGWIFTCRLVVDVPLSCCGCGGSAQGKFLVLGGLKAMNGQLEFFSADDAEVLNAAEHFMCTNVEWDPTGRYVATSVTSIHQMENGFNIWLFNGTLLYRCTARPFSFCAW